MTSTSVWIAMDIAVKYALTRKSATNVSAEKGINWKVTGGHVKVSLLISRFLPCISLSSLFHILFALKIIALSQCRLDFAVSMRSGSLWSSLLHFPKTLHL